jgi:SAM-dependent methyltransferase
MTDAFDAFVHDAQQAHFSGWDFSWLKARLIESPPPWDYVQEIRSRFPVAQTMLDLDTGDGKRLAALAPLPSFTVASESYPPNVSIAARNLRRLGVHVIQVDPNTQHQYGPSQNKDAPQPQRCLPFASNSFDLITCRHGSFSAEEIARLLRSGGTFISQLVGDDNFPHLNDLLHGQRTIWRSPNGPPPPSFEDFGLTILQRREAKPSAIFKDIGAVVYYLKAVPWQIRDFSIETYLPRLRSVHEHVRAHNGLHTHTHRHFIIARKISEVMKDVRI